MASNLEQQILQKVHQLDESDQQRVLNYITSLTESATPQHYNAIELMKLPPEQRTALVQAAIQSSANEDFEIFEAYSEEEFE